MLNTCPPQHAGATFTKLWQPPNMFLELPEGYMRKTIRISYHATQWSPSYLFRISLFHLHFMLEANSWCAVGLGDNWCSHQESVTINETSFKYRARVQYSSPVVFKPWGGMKGIMELLYFQILARRRIIWWTGVYRHHASPPAAESSLYLELWKS